LLSVKETVGLLTHARRVRLRVAEGEEEKR